MINKEQFYQASSSQIGLSSTRRPKSAPKVMGGFGPKMTTHKQTNASNTGLSNEDRVQLHMQLNSYQVGEPGPKVPEHTKTKTQTYIPGLHSPNDPRFVVPGSEAEKAKEVPDALIEGFLDGTKNPISALMEYSVIQKLVIVFEQCPVLKRSILARFACRVKVNGKELPQGTGTTKKSAKTAAAKVALSMLLGVEPDDVDNEDDAGKICFDALGRKTVVQKDPFDDDSASVASSTARSRISELKVRDYSPKINLPGIEEAGVRPIWDPPKHPVSKLSEYCAKRDFKVAWVISDKPTDMGFRADVYICDDHINTAFALTKKDAKRIVSELALQQFAPNEAAEVANYTQLAFKPSKPQMIPAQNRNPNDVTAAGSYHQNSPVKSEPSEAAVSEPGSVSDYIDELQQICRILGYTMEIVVADFPDSCDMYESFVTVDGTVLSLEEGLTKKEAKRAAAKEAIEELKKLKVQPEVPMLSLPFHDRMEVLTLKTFNDLLAPTHENPGLHKHLAAFIVTKSHEDIGHVVAIGTGNTMIPVDERSANGRQIYDSHAVVIARRALLKYFHREIKIYYENKADTIFEPNPGTALLTLKKNVTIRLYMSRSPCGDASADVNGPDIPMSAADHRMASEPMHYPKFPNANSGVTSVKLDQGFMVSPAGRQPPMGMSMSCSDKILKWNTVGLQGSLFSYFLSPIYLSSITIGCRYDHGHVSRALCCRLTQNIAEYLPPGFSVIHPYVGRVSQPDSRHMMDDIAPDSINWSFGDEKIEILSSSDGRCSVRSPFRTSNSGASRLARAGFLYRFRELAKLTGQTSLMQLPTYSDVKLFSKEYLQAKKTLKEHLLLTGFGFWVKKNPNINMFHK